jgi:hypothetical protein
LGAPEYAAMSALLAAAVLLTPRQATAATPSLTVGKVSYVSASKVIGGTNYVWHGQAWPSNVARMVQVNMTNLPAPPVTKIIISWDEPITVMAVDNFASEWEYVQTTVTKTITQPNDRPSRFYRLPVPLQSASMTWDKSPSPNAAGYKVYYGTSPGSYGEPVVVGDVAEHQLTGLEPGRAYYFVVTTYDADAYESEPSNEVSYYVPPVSVAASLRTK